MSSRATSARWNGAVRRFPELKVQLQSKIAYPAISLVMALVALPFAFRLGRQGALYGVGLSIVLGMVFLAIYAFFTTLGEAGALLPPSPSGARTSSSPCSRSTCSSASGPDRRGILTARVPRFSKSSIFPTGGREAPGRGPRGSRKEGAARWTAVRLGGTVDLTAPPSAGLVKLYPEEARSGALGEERSGMSPSRRSAPSARRGIVGGRFVAFMVGNGEGLRPL